MSKVFVSYKRADKDKVFPLVRKMEAVLGIEFWVDLEGIRSDEYFDNVIMNAIDECKVFLFVYSKNHENVDTKNDWTVKELNYANDIGTCHIVFVELESCILYKWFRFHFHHKQVVKADDETAMKNLIEDIRGWLRQSQSVASSSDKGNETDIIDTQTRVTHHQPNPSPNNQGKANDTKDNQEKEVNHQLVTSEEDKPHPQAIDLGLPSGTKWASFNVGATKPEGYGDYFAWGETEKKDCYSWDTYSHCDGDINSCYNLGSDIAGTEYDVAHEKWGGSWRMPTFEQIKELLEHCNHKNFTQNGVKGYKFISKDGKNSIFLPMAGRRNNDDLGFAGYSGYYWSSTISKLSNMSRAYDLYISYNLGKEGRINADGRDYGRSVRPVVRN